MQRSADVVWFTVRNTNLYNCNFNTIFTGLSRRDDAFLEWYDSAMHLDNSTGSFSFFHSLGCNITKKIMERIEILADRVCDSVWISYVVRIIRIDQAMNYLSIWRSISRNVRCQLGWKFDTRCKNLLTIGLKIRHKLQSFILQFFVEKKCFSQISLGNRVEIALV